MTYKLESRFIGYPPVASIVLAANVAAQVASGNLPTPGVPVNASDKVWGGAELIWARANGAIRQYAMCVLTPVWDATGKTFTQNMTEVPNTANLGRSVYVAQANGAMAAGDYGWFMDSGVTPINGTATVAADTTYGITAAGQVGANTAGKQILNSRVVTPATQTVVKAAVSGASGDNYIYFSETDGFFVGGYVAGTGVGASAIISDIDPLGKWIKVSVVNSAAVTGNVTQTANNGTIFYNVAALDRSFAQGAIT
jgi:hypothetical protein